MAAAAPDAPPVPGPQSTTTTPAPQLVEGFLHQYKDAFAGSAAGLISKTMLQPLDLIKTRLQVQDAGKASYRGVFHAFRVIYSSSGVTGFYQGFTPNLLGSGVSWGCYFYTYAWGKRFYRQMLHGNTSVPPPPPAATAANAAGKPDVKLPGKKKKHKEDHLGPLVHTLCAAQAGIITVFVTNPLWMIKTRFQLQAKGVDAEVPYTGILNAFSRIVREEGPMALYRGVGPALWLVSNGALQFMAYEELRKLTVDHVVETDDRLHTAHFLAMGGAAKAFSTSVTYPLQVIRSRLYQRAPKVAAADAAAGGAAEGAVPAPAKSVRSGAKYDSARQVMKHVMKEHGFKGFYQGIVPHLLKTAPSSAITFLVYEQVIRFLGKLEGTRQDEHAAAHAAAQQKQQQQQQQQQQQLQEQQRQQMSEPPRP